MRFYALMLRSEIARGRSENRTFAETFSREVSKYEKTLARPTGIEPVLRVPETLVISFSLRALEKFFLSSGCNSVNARFACDHADDSHHFAVN